MNKEMEIATVELKALTRRFEINEPCQTFCPEGMLALAIVVAQLHGFLL